MKIYEVRYSIKAGRSEVRCSMIVSANNAKEACKICKDRVKENFRWNAFRPVAKRVGCDHG